MKTLNLLSAVVILTGISVVSCQKSQVSPSVASASFKMQASSKIQPVTKSLVASATDLAASGFAWETATIVVSKIELEAEHEHKVSGIAAKTMVPRAGGTGSDYNGSPGTGNDNNSNSTDSVNFEWRGPKTVDLFNLNSVIGDVNLVPGKFDNLTIQIKSFKSDAPTSPLFYLTGVYTNSTGTAKRIKFIVNEDFELKVTKADTLDFSNDFTSIIKMNLSLLMSGVTQTELDNAVLTNDALVISSAVNVTLYNRLKKNLHDSGESEFEKN